MSKSQTCGQALCVSEIQQKLDLSADFQRSDLTKMDRRAIFPQAQVDWLNKHDVQCFYIPDNEQGKLQSLTQIVDLWRSIAAHDLSISIAHGKTFLGSICIWIAGSEVQKNKVKIDLLNHESVSWGLTECSRGADLMATETVAKKNNQGWLVDGEKWLINNATRSNLITLLARTSEDSGARNLSLFLVDKRELTPTQWECLEKINTYGIRGADISGIKLKGAQLKPESLIGVEGQGLEVTVKALQLTRTACCGLSLGALDSAIEMTSEMVRRQRMYGKYLIELDTVQTNLANAVVTLWLAEVSSWFAARHANFLVDEMSIVSTIAKGKVPSMVATQLSLLEEQMGARGFLEDLFADGAFEKLIRDHQIVPIFDGSTLVNRVGLSQHLTNLAKMFKKGTFAKEKLDSIGCWESEVESVDFGSLSLISRKGCSLVQSIPNLVRRALDEQAKDVVDHCLAPVLSSFLRLTEKIIGSASELVLNQKQASINEIALAKQYECLFVGASCIQFWLSNPRLRELRGVNQHWLTLCLEKNNIDLMGGVRVGRNNDLFKQLKLSVLETEDTKTYSIFNAFSAGGEK